MIDDNDTDYGVEPDQAVSKPPKGKFVTDWNLTITVRCPRCKSGVEMRLWESDDGAFEDEQYRCVNTDCGHMWWVESSDY